MKKSLVVLSLIMAIMLVLPLSSYAWEATDTALYINSDTTDIYSGSFKKVFGKTFSTLDEYTNLSGWSISGDYDFSDTNGMILNSVTSSAIYNANQFDGKYTFKASVVNKMYTDIQLYFNYIDAKNYYSLYIDAYEGNVKLEKVINSQKTLVSTKNVSDFKIKSENKFEFEITSDSGDNISVWYTIDGERKNLFEDITVDGAKLTYGKVGVGFAYNNFNASVKSINVYKVYDKDLSNVSNTIDGKIVTYKDAGRALLAVAFYDGTKLVDVFTKNVTLAEGNNDFEIDINSEENLNGKKIKYFLFDDLSNITPLIVANDVSSFRENGFSDVYEPYLPMATASTLSVDDMYTKIAVGKNVLTTREKADRLAVLDMYKKAGFDITADLADYLSSDILQNSAPTTFSRLTPKSLTGDYEQSYSVDAPWNNPIPSDNPKTRITSWASDGDYDLTMQITSTRPKNATSGDGLGMPIIIGKDGDEVETVVAKYDASTTASKTYAGKIRVPSNYGDLLNNRSTGDRHAIFIDDVTKTALQTWHTVASDSTKGYNWETGLLPNFDARSNASTSVVELTGIGNDRHAGVNAAGIPMDSITLKKSDITDADSDITHALGAALANMMKARVFPAYDMDNGVSKATSEKGITGCVPYGGLIQLDPSLDLEGLYASKKLSLPGYKILKAWRDYGIYNVDRSGSANNGHMLLYSSATYEDWKDSNNPELNVPFKNGAQGMEAVSAEINALISGNSYFDLSEAPAFYVTIPVVKYTSYDVNGDGAVTDDDKTTILNNIDEEFTINNEHCDVNMDGVINEDDVNFITRYLGGQVSHKPATYKVSGVSSTGGVVNVSYTTPKHGEYYTVTAVPSNGYEFAGWNAEYTDVYGDASSNVLVVRAESDASYGAKFKKMPEYSVTFKANDENVGTIAVSSSMKSGTYYSKEYGTYTYNGNYLCSVLPTPIDGYVFDAWKIDTNGDGVADVESHSKELSLYINSDMTVTCNFVQVTASDSFSSSTLSSKWVTNIETYDKPKFSNIITSGAMLLKDSSLFNEKKYIILNKDSASGNGILDYNIKVKADAGLDGENYGRIIFGYASHDDFWFVDFNSTGQFNLKHISDEKTPYSSFTPTLENPLDATAYVTVNIVCTKEGTITVKLYQNDAVYEMDPVDTGKMITGYTGMGTKYASGIYFDDYSVNFALR